MSAKPTSDKRFTGYDFDKDGFKLYGIRLADDESKTERPLLDDTVRALKNGTIIKGKSNTFRIVGQIQKNGYKVQRLGSLKEKEYFMRVESPELPVNAPQLKRCVFFLQNLKGQRDENKKHFLKLVDRGRVPGQYNYLVTTMADLNLDDLRKSRLKAQFKPPTALALSAQTLQAIHDVHLNQYIHRDIRPSNFFVGFAPAANIVYLIGFSLAYKYFPSRKASVQKDAKPQTPRKLTKWQTTKCKFQSRSYHLGNGIARIDDLESWFYMCIDFFGQTLLPWHRTSSEKEIFLCKQRLFYDGCEQIYNVVPKNFRAIKNAISTTSKVDPVDYTLFADILLSCSNVPYDLYGPFEWEEELNESESKIRTAAPQEPFGVSEKINVEALTNKEEVWDRQT